MLPTITVNFTDFYKGFDKNDNSYLRCLKKRYHVEFSETPDFLFYSCFGFKFTRYPQSVRIFVTGEPVTPNFNDCDYAIGFDPIHFEDRYLRFPWYSDLIDHQPDKTALSPAMAQRKFCNFVYNHNRTSGGNLQGRFLRQELCLKLLQYKRVDCPGKSLHNMDEKIVMTQNKLDFLAQYKFTIAVDSCDMNGFTSEKLVHAFAANSVPIYWGNPLVTQDFNPKSFINCSDFASLDDVVQRVVELDQNDSQYLAMLREPPTIPDFYEKYRQDVLEQFLFHLIEKGKKPFCKDPCHRGRYCSESPLRYFFR